MKLHRWLLAVFALAGAGFALAQGPFWPGPYAYGRASFGHGRFMVGFGVRGPYMPPVFRSITSVRYITILTPPPPPPIFILRPVLELPPREDDPPPLPRREAPPAPMPPDIPAVPDVPPVPDIVPKVGEAPPPLPREEKPPPPRPRPRPRQGKGELVLPTPPDPFDDPIQEHRRQLQRGRGDFATRQYGRAAERFRRASTLQPHEALPLFLLAQCLLAQEKYHDASDAIRAGLRLAPDWPKGDFRAIDLYGPDVRSYPEHARQLAEARARFPNEPVLLFLAGYQAWFDGRKDEAAMLLRRSLPAFAVPVERFLRALPGDDLL